MSRGRKRCTFTGCDKYAFAHGYCAGHAAQQRRGAPLAPLRQPRPDASEGFSWCSKCKQFRSVDEFGWDGTRDALKRVCRPCAAAYQATYNANNREQIALRITLAQWGLTEAQYVALFEAQQHRCAICGAERRAARNLSIDHDHATGVVRGLLCQDCNMGLGQFGDDPARLEAAAAYVRAGGVVHDASMRVPEQSVHARRARTRKEARDARR